MTTDSLAGLRQAIAKRFASAAAAADERLLKMGFGPNAHIIWLEEFCRCTTNAIAAGEEEIVRAHLAFMSSQLSRGDEATRSAIGVAYVEPLLHELKSERKRWAWPLMPTNVKRLYVDMWGAPRF